MKIPFLLGQTGTSTEGPSTPANIPGLSLDAFLELDVSGFSYGKTFEFIDDDTNIRRTFRLVSHEGTADPEDGMFRPATPSGNKCWREVG